MNKRAWLFPGQGTQRRGMGGELFDLFPGLVRMADEILGYSIRELCLEDPGNRLGLTEFSQPAMFVVNALQFLHLRRTEPWPDFVAGHSLGEYNALFAAGSFDFETGLRLVKARAKWMSTAGVGSMLAVIGLELDALQRRMEALRVSDLDIANYNLPDQLVLSGPEASIARIDEDILRLEGTRTVHLHIGGAFHSRHARSAAAGFQTELERFPLSDPKLPTISSVTERPIAPNTVRDILSVQILRPVNWVGVMTYLREQGTTHARQIGPGRVLDGLWERFLAREGLPMGVSG